MQMLMVYVLILIIFVLIIIGIVNMDFKENNEKEIKTIIFLLQEIFSELQNIEFELEDLNKTKDKQEDDGK